MKTGIWTMDTLWYIARGLDGQSVPVEVAGARILCNGRAVGDIFIQDREGRPFEDCSFKEGKGTGPRAVAVFSSLLDSLATIGSDFHGEGKAA